MRVLLYLSLSAALLCTVIFADHEEDHKEKDDHKHDHDGHHHKDHSTESEACRPLELSKKTFAYELFGQVAEEHPTENIFFSPESIAVALSYLALGAKGKTHDQILKGISFNASEFSEKDIHSCFHDLLEVQNTKDRELKLNSGSALFVSQDWKILDEFLEKAKKNYQSEPIPADFKDNEEAKKQINGYVEKKTDGKIVDVLSSVNPDAVFVFVNYINFRGEWERPFDEQFTQEGDFHINENETVKVPFMKKTGFQDVAYLEDSTVVVLPYKGNATALFILPKEGKVKKVEANLQDTVKAYKKSHRRTFVDISIPKFQISTSYDLKELLVKRGIVDVFTDWADLSGITGAANIKISQALHEAYIGVDEKGTEASGATVLEAIPMMLPPHIKFDHTFFMSIYDHKTRSILFLLKVVNPLK